MKKSVTGVYRDAANAEAAVSALLDAHFEVDDVRVVLVTPEGRRPVPMQHAMPMGRGGVWGGAIGLVLGVTASVPVATGVLPEPGMGLVTVADGPALAALKGGFVAGAIGALTGFLVGMGIWKGGVQLDVPDTATGRILVGVQVTPRRVDPVQQLLERHHATEVTVCTPGDPTCEQAWA